MDVSVPTEYVIEWADRIIQIIKEDLVICCDDDYDGVCMHERLGEVVDDMLQKARGKKELA